MVLLFQSIRRLLALIPTPEEIAQEHDQPSGDGPGAASADSGAGDP